MVVHRILFFRIRRKISKAFNTSNKIFFELSRLTFFFFIIFLDFSFVRFFNNKKERIKNLYFFSVEKQQFNHLQLLRQCKKFPFVGFDPKKYISRISGIEDLRNFEYSQASTSKIKNFRSNGLGNFRGTFPENKYDCGKVEIHSFLEHPKFSKSVQQRKSYAVLKFCKFRISILKNQLFEIFKIENH